MISELSSALDIERKRLVYVAHGMRSCRGVVVGRKETEGGRERQKEGRKRLKRAGNIFFSYPINPTPPV